jgi:phosphoglycerate dehydrogenase-like enzyme
MSATVVYLGPPESVDWVRRGLGSGYELRHCLTASQVDEALPGAVAILDAFMKIPFPASRLGSAVCLRVVVTATTGANHIDESALSARGIPLLTLRGQRELLRNITPAAEHSWLLLMACARGLRAATDHVLAGGWDRNLHPGVMLNGRTLGIIGCGRIGQWMARYAEAFGMRRLGFDPHLNTWPPSIERVDLHDLLAESDFISIHVTLTEETRGLIGPAEFARIKPGACLVNTSRGEVVDPASLLEALQSGRLRGAGLDVLASEPEIESDPLLAFARAHPNLFITPHIGGYSPDALRVVLDFSCRRLVSFLDKGAL